MTVLVGNHDFLTGCKLNGDSVLNAEFCLEYVEISTNGVTQIKKTSEVQAMGFTNPSKTSKIDIEEAQAIIKSNIDVAEYLQESKGNFKFLVRHERRICMHQIEFDGRISFEFEFLVDFNTRVAKLSGEHPISSQYKAMKLVIETQKIAQHRWLRSPHTLGKILRSKRCHHSVCNQSKNHDCQREQSSQGFLICTHPKSQLKSLL